MVKVGGATTAEKLRDQGLGPNTVAIWGECRRGLPVAPPAVWVRGYYPRKIFENSDAKSCIPVASALISGLARTCISEQTTSMSISTKMSAECGVIDEIFAVKFLAFWKLRPKSWPVSPGPTVVAPMVKTLKLHWTKATQFMHLLISGVYRSHTSSFMKTHWKGKQNFLNFTSKLGRWHHIMTPHRKHDANKLHFYWITRGPTLKD